jgi:NTE family protein
MTRAEAGPAMKTAVVFQGGGPLGAFGCGAWLAVAPWLRQQGHTLVGVAGASIGALNSAAIACHAGSDDLGAAALHRLWREHIATPPPLPPLPLPRWLQPAADEMRAWTGWWSGFTLGNPALFTPLYAHWHPLAGLRRASLPLYSQGRMRRLFRTLVGEGYASGAVDQPLLAVAATEVLHGGLRVFTSDELPITPDVLCASAAIPLMFKPVTLQGRLYCDGEVNHRSPVGDLVDALQASGRVAPGEALQLITIGQFCHDVDHPPRSAHELADRALQLMLAGKLAGEPARVARRIDITRLPHPNDGISGQFDYTAPRIQALIDAGERRALQALQAPATPIPSSTPANLQESP